MHTNALRRIQGAVEKGTGATLIGLMSLLSFMVLPVTASAAELTAESTSLSTPQTSATGVTYTVTQSSVSLSAIKCIKVQFNTVADGSGVIPTGMNVSSATINAATNYATGVSGWTVANPSSGVLTLSSATAATPSSATGRTVVLDAITNGSTANTTYFTIVTTYSDQACTTSVDTNGQSTFVFTSGVSVSATVNPTLTFTVDSTTCNLGTLTASTTGSCSHTMTAASNANSGYSISYIASPTLTSGANTITANNLGNGVALANAVGGEQFGLNLVANITPSVGANKSGDTTPTIATNYNVANSFAFKLAGDTIATTTAPSTLTTFTVSYIANISAITEAGLYTKTQTYNITATY